MWSRLLPKSNFLPSWRFLRGDRAQGGHWGLWGCRHPTGLVWSWMHRSQFWSVLSDIFSCHRLVHKCVGAHISACMYICIVVCMVCTHSYLSMPCVHLRVHMHMCICIVGLCLYGVHVCLGPDIQVNIYLCDTCTCGLVGGR